MNEKVLRLARIIWDYHQLHQEPVPADVIIALGTNDLRVAEFAADLYLRGYGRTLLCTGGMAHQGDLLATPWPKSEAEMYADVAEFCGVPRENMLLETRATNTAENIRFARDLLCAQKIVAGMRRRYRRGRGFEHRERSCGGYRRDLWCRRRGA